jgi:hypothetical protein
MWHTEERWSHTLITAHQLGRGRDFRRNLGDPEVFIRIHRAILCVGAMVAVLALIPSGRKRWAAWAALAAHLLLLGSEQGWLLINRR